MDKSTEYRPPKYYIIWDKSYMIHTSGISHQQIGVG